MRMYLRHAFFEETVQLRRRTTACCITANHHICFCLKVCIMQAPINSVQLLAHLADSSAGSILQHAIALNATAKFSSSSCLPPAAICCYPFGVGVLATTCRVKARVFTNGRCHDSVTTFDPCRALALQTSSACATPQRELHVG